MNKLNTNETPKQLGFADLTDPRPLPLIVAERWQFPLKYHIVNSICYFSVIDWIAGIGSTDQFRAADTWRKLQPELRISNPDGIPADFVSDVHLYDIAQGMRVTKQRPALKAIQDYLSQSGSTMDEWRREPEKMLSIAESRMKKDIERHEKAGLGNRPEIVHLKSEFEVKQSLKAMNDLLNNLIDNPDYARIHNAKLLSLFGATSAQIKAMLHTKDIHKSLPAFQLDHIDFAHKQIIQILRMQGGAVDNQRVIETIAMVVEPLGVYLRGICERLGIDHITGQPLIGKGRG